MKTKSAELLWKQWRRFIKYPIQKWNGYITESKGVYKIVEIRLARHFSYVNICKVDKDGNLGRPVYITGVGTDWRDTITRLTTNMSGFITRDIDYWVDWSVYTK